MILYTKRLTLRPWQDSDAEDLYEFASDPLVGPPAGWPPHTSVENSLSIIREVLSLPETYAVVLRATGRAIGSIGLLTGAASNLPLCDGEAELGYWVGVPYWGRGLIPEAARVLLRHGFEHLRLTAVWCGYYDGNEKSWRVQQKMGFSYHHTNVNVNCSLMNEVRTEHITRLTMAGWQSAEPV